MEMYTLQAAYIKSEVKHLVGETIQPLSICECVSQYNILQIT